MAAPSRDVQMIRVAAPHEADAAAPSAAVPAPRDVASLFPNAAKRQKDDAALGAAARMREAIGATRFVKGETVVLGAEEHEPPAAAAAASAPYPYSSKSLAEQLAERKAAAEQERDESRRALARGGARPLEPDELEFLGRVRDAELAAERRRLADEASGVAEYRRAVEELAAAEQHKRRREEEEQEGAGIAVAAAAAAAVAVPAPKPRAGGAALPRRGLPLPRLVVVGGGGAGASADKKKKKKETEQQQQRRRDEGDGGEAAPGPSSSAPPPQPPPTLGGLLGAYGSSSSQEEDGGD